jgi:cytochrome c oxidase subunit 2
MSFPQSMLHAAGPQAGAIEWLWWMFVAVCSAVFVVVLLATAMAAFRPGRQVPRADAASDSRAARAVGIATAVSAVLLFVLLSSSIVTGRRVQSLNNPAHVEVRITGQQWWWAVDYPSSTPALNVRTANEIHIPVGRPVLVKLSSTDVIHSFWVPQLHGKKDLIPGHDNTIWIQADRPGVYRGQCAEFCGHQHAHMAFYVVAQSPDDYARWIDGQRQPAREPSDDAGRRGQEIFLSSSCVMCHTIRGTQAGSRLGPDLTHVASRLSLAAGTLPNTTGHLAGWIADSQGIKPGNRMPTIAVPAEDLQALVAYLRQLE